MWLPLEQSSTFFVTIVAQSEQFKGKASRCIRRRNHKFGFPRTWEGQSFSRHEWRSEVTFLFAHLCCRCFRACIGVRMCEFVQWRPSKHTHSGMTWRFWCGGIYERLRAFGGLPGGASKIRPDANWNEICNPKWGKSIKNLRNDFSMQYWLRWYIPNRS